MCQTVTAFSSTEAEFIAASIAAKAARCPRVVLQELGQSQDGPTEMHIDIQAALQMIDGNPLPLPTFWR